MRRRFMPLVLFLAILAPREAAAQLTVAAASDLQNVMPAITSRFERTTGQAVSVSYGSSGQFFSQIQNGAPFDVFLSADESYARRLVDSGRAIRSTLVPYASGRLALWTRKDSGIDVSKGLTSVNSTGVRRVAIANPEHAPYGQAAVDALKRAGIYDQLRPRLVLGENVAQAAQFAQTGNADVAIIALSLTRTPAMQASGTTFEIPPDAHLLIRQSAVVLSRTPERPLAERFIAFLTSNDVAALLAASGFGARQ